MIEKSDNQPRAIDAKLKRLNVVMGLALFAIAALTAAVWFVSATSISNRRDMLSNQQISETSRHQISFNLSAGNTFASGEEVVVDLPPEFALAGTWAQADFSFTDGACC
jgi:hypothetical protein